MPITYSLTHLSHSQHGGDKLKKILTLSSASALIILLSLALIAAACGTREIKEEDIQFVTLTVGRPGQEEHTVVTFKDPANFKHFLAVEKVLAKYDPQQHMVKTWKLDIKFEYHLTNEEIITREFKGIRPVDEFLKDLYNSREYKEQTIPLFKLDKGEIKKVKFESHINNYEFMSDDPVLINTVYENLLEYYQEHENLAGENDYLIANVEFLAADDTQLAGGPILRGDKK